MSTARSLFSSWRPSNVHSLQDERENRGWAFYTLQVAVFRRRQTAQKISQFLAGSWVEEFRAGDRLTFRVNYRCFHTEREALAMQPLLANRGYRSVVRVCE